MRRRRVAISLVAYAALLIASTSCSNQSPTARIAPEITGLAAVPASAEVVIVADVPRIVHAPLVERAFDQLLVRDPALAARWAELRDGCKLDVKQFSHVTLAIGPHSEPQPGTGPVLIVATGHLVETEFSACVRAMVGKGGGSLTAKALAKNRTVYEATQGNRTMYFAFGRADTVLLSASEAFLTEALGAGKKLLDNPGSAGVRSTPDNRDMAKWIAMVNQKAPLWAVGKVDPRVRDGLVRVMAGKISSGPQVVVASFDPSAGAALELGVVMATSGDVKNLESFAKIQLAALGMAAQAKALGSIVSKIQISTDCAAGQTECSTVRFVAKLDHEDINQLISALDGGTSSAQSSPPQEPKTGSGSGGL